jgi:hypothetical protein
MPRPARKRLRFDEESMNDLLQEIYDDSLNIKQKAIRLFNKWEVKIKETGEVAAIGDQLIKLIAAEAKNADQKLLMLKYLKEVVYDSKTKTNGDDEKADDISSDSRQALIDMVHDEMDKEKEKTQ